MSPEEHSQPTVLDLVFMKEDTGLSITPVDVPVKDWLAVSWASKVLPEVYFLVVDDVIYFSNQPNLQTKFAKGEADKLNNYTYG